MFAAGQIVLGARSASILAAVIGAAHGALS
jgi:hypothetical protein